MRSIAIAISLLFCISASATLKLPMLISDGMILQRDTRLKIWGWGAPGEKLTLSFNGNKVNTITGQDGKWLVTLPAMKAGGPFAMTIKGTNEITVNDILLGDVWFCSGQSNMELVMQSANEKYADEIAGANYPQIRQVYFPRVADAVNMHDDVPQTKWLPALPANVGRFSAVAYFFAKKIYEKYHVPIGIINSSVGGTPIESWMSKDAIHSFPKYDSLVEKLKDTVYLNQVTRPAVTGVSPFTTPDAGLSGPVKWYDLAYVPEGWHPFWMPGYWADQGVKNLNGTVWFRKEVNVPASMVGVPAKLYLGGISNAENTYVNGIPTGNAVNLYPAKRYDLAAGVLKAGKNVVVVKIMNRSGKGGFVPGKDYGLSAADQRIDLRGDWEYKVGQIAMPPAGNAFSMQNTATSLYNGMVYPAINYAVKGFLWYQGEANAGRPAEYQQLLPAMIKDWRNQWQQGDLPFLFVQLANYMEVQYWPVESSWAELRESQRQTLSVTNTGMAVATDVGNWNDIHPYNKKDVGERLALSAERVAYGDKTIVFSGPILSSTTKENNKILLGFTSTGSGMIAKGGNELQHFAIAGADKKYVWAKAVIEGDKVIVSHPAIANPVYVRYAWSDNPEFANLYNKEGLPASAFETHLGL